MNNHSTYLPVKRLAPMCTIPWAECVDIRGRWSLASERKPARTSRTSFCWLVGSKYLSNGIVSPREAWYSNKKCWDGSSLQSNLAFQSRSVRSATGPGNVWLAVSFFLSIPSFLIRSCQLRKIGYTSCCVHVLKLSHHLSLFSIDIIFLSQCMCSEPVKTRVCARMQKKIS